MDKTVSEKHTKACSIRFSRRQKKRFIEALHQDFHASGYEPMITEGKKLLSHAHNYLYGNMKQMKTAIVIPYGTSERKFWKKVLYFPFDGTRAANKTTVTTYVPIFLFSVLILKGLYGLRPLTTSTGLASLISCGLFLLIVMLICWMMHSFHNAHNHNRNSATMAATAETVKGLDRDECRKVGLLFIDKNRTRPISAETAVKDLVDAGKNPILICLDCITKGSVVQISFNPQNYKSADKITKYHPKKESIDIAKLNEEMRAQNAMAYFRRAVVISCGELNDVGSLRVIGTGTGKDRDIELEILDDNIIMMKEYLYNQR